MADTYDAFGTWKLEEFDLQLDGWRNREHPPLHLFEQVQAWLPRMEHGSERTRARLATDEATAEGGGQDNVYVLRVPGCYFLDESTGVRRVLCIFQVFEESHRVVCRAFHTTAGEPVT